MKHARPRTILHTRTVALPAASVPIDDAQDRCSSVTPFPARDTVPDGEARAHNRQEYAIWDAAYVVGSLSAKDRREFEAHLAGCPSCWAAVTELSGIPALLALLDHDEVAAICELASSVGGAAEEASCNDASADRSGQ